MSIWASRWAAGADAWEDEGHEGGVLGAPPSHLYPDAARDKVAGIDTAQIPQWCVPGQEDQPERYDAVGPWLRLGVTVWMEKYGRPMVHEGSEVVIDSDAARALAAELIAWADLPKIRPTP